MHTEEEQTIASSEYFCADETRSFSGQKNPGLFFFHPRPGLPSQLGRRPSYPSLPPFPPPQHSTPPALDGSKAEQSRAKQSKSIANYASFARQPTDVRRTSLRTLPANSRSSTSGLRKEGVRDCSAPYIYILPLFIGRSMARHDVHLTQLNSLKSNSSHSLKSKWTRTRY